MSVNIVISEELPQTLSHKTRSSSKTTANHLNLHKNTVRQCRLVGTDELVKSSSEPTIKNEFLIYAIEEYKFSKNLNGKEVVDLFLKFGVFDYILDNYESMHTTGGEYVVKDIDLFIEKRSAPSL
ncbi:hypothetical protein AGMMS49938_16550 [Fibrobacterales bacterium]|nr:hypothetical protein AGMMS49938_16550 [Fibrobacterales bacterium]